MRCPVKTQVIRDVTKFKFTSQLHTHSTLMSTEACPTCALDVKYRKASKRMLKDVGFHQKG